MSNFAIPDSNFVIKSKNLKESRDNLFRVINDLDWEKCLFLLSKLVKEWVPSNTYEY